MNLSVFSNLLHRLRPLSLSSCCPSHLSSRQKALLSGPSARLNESKYRFKDLSRLLMPTRHSSVPRFILRSAIKKQPETVCTVFSCLKSAAKVKSLSGSASIAARRRMLAAWPFLLHLQKRKPMIPCVVSNAYPHPHPSSTNRFDSIKLGAIFGQQGGPHSPL